MAGSSAATEDLQLILLEVERCHEILGLMAARAAGSADDAGPLSVDELMRRVRAHLGDEQGKRVEFRLDPAEPELHLPPGQTTQSVVALVQNALDASAPSGTVVVVLSRRGSRAQIRVEDRGAGIPEGILSRLGEPFFTTKPPGRGLGLGIFLVRAFAESRGGELVIESTLGVGTCAQIHIPMRSGSAAGVA